MKQFGKIFQFELRGILKNKVFLGVTLFLVVAIGVVMFLPNLSALFQTGGEEEQTSAGELPVLALSLPEGELGDRLTPVFAAAFADYAVTPLPGGARAVEQAVAKGEADCGFAVQTDRSYTYYVTDLALTDDNPDRADAALEEAYRLTALTQSGLSPEQAADILAARAEHTVVTLGKDQMQNFFYTYLMIFALYMVILLYGQMVATNVAVEKSSRAMEVLITSAKPVAMMFGKVFASCTAGLIQLAAVFGSAMLFYQLNESAWAGNGLVAAFFHIPVGLFVYLLVFFLFGFLIYAFLYGAIGSTASKLEDINTSVMPVTFLFIIAFFVVVFSMTSGNVDNLLMKICSFVPFTSPMAMFTRICMSAVPWYEIALSLALLAVGVAAVGWVSAKIYRVGVLLYGTKPTLRTLAAALKRK